MTGPVKVGARVRVARPLAGVERLWSWPLAGHQPFAVDRVDGNVCYGTDDVGRRVHAPADALEVVTGADVVRRHADVHYGVPVVELGEDGGTLLALGHHSDQRTVAAFARFARKTWGESLDSVRWDYPPGGLVGELKCVRAIVVHACHRGWSAEKPIPTPQLALLDPADDPCADCTSETDSTWALLYRADVQDHPQAFPVTVWEYDA